jgi:hypothetical protein
MKVAPNTVSGRVVKTRIGFAPTSTGKSISAPSLRPIQLRCMSLIGSGQSSSSMAPSSSSA